MANGTVLMLVGPEYEDLEVWYPNLRLEEAGYEVKLAGLGEREYRSKHGYPCKPDGTVRDFPAAGLVGTICHGPWVLISAGIVRGRRMTSTVGISDDVVNAGAEWVDQASVIDGNLVSSRVPKDLPAFGVALLEVLKKQR